jgi:ParB-like chromosome segregation protein Spo0J
LSIKEFGQLQPIVVNEDGIVLDGHVRFRVCSELKIKPKFVVVDLASEIEEQLYIIDVNLCRASYGDFQKCSVAWALEPLLAERARLRVKAQTTINDYT